MKKIPDTTNIIARHSDRHVPPEGPSSNLNAIVLEMTREQQCFAKHTKRMKELKKMASLQERVIHRMLDKSIEEPAPPERPQLKLVK